MTKLDEGMAEAPAPSSAVGRVSPVERKLRAIVDAHGESLWLFVRRLGIPEADVDDAVQEIILVLARRLGDVRDGAERSFLFSTAVRVASGFRRKKARHPEIADAAAIESRAHPSQGPERDIDDVERRAELDRILEAMPMEQRAVFVLYEIEEHTMAEISEVLDVPAGTVASRLRRAREAFEAEVARLRARRSRTEKQS